MSASPATEGVSDLVSRGLSKSLGVMDLAGLKNLQNRSLRTRSMKASIKQRLKSLTAEPLEALEVAREIDKLVSHGASRCDQAANPLCINSPCHSPRMKNSAATMNSSPKTWRFYVAQSQTGQYLTKASRHCQNLLLLWRAGNMKRTDPCR
jgi:hypothetical protein